MHNYLRFAGVKLGLCTLGIVAGCGPSGTSSDVLPGGGILLTPQLIPGLGGSTTQPAGNVGPAAAPSTSADPLQPFLGSYTATFSGRVGTSSSLIVGPVIGNTVAGLVNTTSTGTIILSASRLGILTLSAGDTIAGVDPQDLISGPAIVQNPLDVTMGTPLLAQAGDFSLGSITTLAQPADIATLIYDGCSSNGQGVTSCVPVFFRTATSTDQGVNLIYFTTEAAASPGTLTLTSQLRDLNLGAATTPNTFIVPLTTPAGLINDTFAFDRGATFQMTVSGNALSGSIQATGLSTDGQTTQAATFEMTFQGTRQ